MKTLQNGDFVSQDLDVYKRQAVVKFKNGAIGSIEGTTNVYPKNLEETLYLFGQNGTVKLGGKSCKMCIRDRPGLCGSAPGGGQGEARL